MSAPATYRCPDDVRWRGDLVGCGETFTGAPDGEGLVDCPRCGLWFRPAKPAPVEPLVVARAYAALRSAERDLLAARQAEDAAYQRAETASVYPGASLMQLTGRRFAAQLTRNRWRHRIADLERESREEVAA